MNETLDYIAAYFENSLTAEERMQFEQRITTDAAFAGEVAFYLQAQQALRQELLQQKEKSWQAAPELLEAKPAPVIVMKKPSLVRRWMAAAAASVVAVGTTIAFLLSGGGAVQMANHYVATELKQLSPSMGATRDSLQQGIAAYNEGNWDKAGAYFEGIYAAHPDTVEALKYSGLVALQKKEYDKAISRFGQLAAYPGLLVNDGLFYQAITLLVRNEKGDEDKARQLMQEVVDKNLHHANEAKEYLQKLK